MGENIALIKQTHQSYSTHNALEDAKESLEKIGLAPLADKRVSELSDEEIFYIMVIRASKMQCDQIVISYLFTICNEFENLQALKQNFQKLKIVQDIIFIDLSSNKNRYEELQCHMKE